jgi:hypothetical protein
MQVESPILKHTTTRLLKVYLYLNLYIITRNIIFCVVKFLMISLVPVGTKNVMAFPKYHHM